MASDKDLSKPHDIPLEDIQHHRGVAQEQSMNTLLGAQQRYQNASSQHTRDSIYDAIADAKRQISEKDNIPFGGKVGGDNTEGDAQKEEQEGADNSTSKNVMSSVGETLSGYAKNIKDAIAGSGDNKGEGTNVK